MTKEEEERTTSRIIANAIGVAVGSLNVLDKVMESLKAAEAHHAKYHKDCEWNSE